MGNSKLLINFPNRIKSISLLVCLFVLITCKKTDNTTHPQPNTNFQLGFVEVPASVYAAIPNASSPAPTGALPSSFFLETPSTAFDQSTQGSCVSCATAMAKSILDHTRNAISYPNNGIIYSPSYIFNQVHLDPNNCLVGSYVYANLEILKNQGVCKLTEMPYYASNCTTQPNSNQKTLASSNKIDYYFKVDPISISLIKAFIHAGCAVIIAFQIDDYFINSTSSNNTIWSQFGSVSRGNHAALLYGWDDSKSAFKMLNSWGNGWGNNGTIWVDYSFLQNGASTLYGRIFKEAYILQNSVTPSNAPVADFDVNGGTTSISVGQQVNFRDRSSNAPTSLSWSFPGGTPSTSTSQNPVITYNTEGTYSVTLTASNSAGSNSKTITSYINVSSSLNWACGQPFTDPRDGNVYTTVNINGQCWMAENLRYTNNGSVGVTYNNSSSNYNTYGRLYSFYQVVNSNLAPVGWHIPTEAEVFALHNYVINTYNNQGYGPLKSTSTLWSPPNTVATNATGFTALPSGRYQNNVFSDLGFVFYMWSSSSYGAGKGYAMYFRYDGSGGAEGLDDNNYFAIRCLRN